MILLDHNIPEQQVERLRRARLRPQQIGHEVGRPEWLDFEEILRYLHRRKAVTFFTRDTEHNDEATANPVCRRISSGLRLMSPPITKVASAFERLFERCSVGLRARGSALETSGC